MPCFDDGGQRKAGSEAAHGGAIEDQCAGIKLYDIADDGEPETGAWHAFVEPFAAFADLAAFVRRQAGTVILHTETDIGPGIFGRDTHMAVTPLAGIVDEIASHFLKVLAFAAKGERGRTIHVDGEGAFRMNLAQYARQIL